jgi:hypothetical protein
MAPSAVARECNTGKRDIQFLGAAFSYFGAEKKQSHFWLCFEWRVGFKILF